mmetsp:Transcript_55434/g.76832  ORF Transcript_55434/g.76832 Transcript_55434/m.76832 type:complete len:129 (-) Transcript_55434:387-773(-)
MKRQEVMHIKLFHHTFGPHHDLQGLLNVTRDPVLNTLHTCIYTPSVSSAEDSSFSPATSATLKRGEWKAATMDDTNNQPKDAATISRDQLPEIAGISSTPPMLASPRNAASIANALPARSRYRFAQMA